MKRYQPSLNPASRPSTVLLLLARLLAEVHTRLVFGTFDCLTPEKVLRPLRRYLRPIVEAGLHYPIDWIRGWFVDLAREWDLAELGSLVLAATRDAYEGVRNRAICLAHEWNVAGVEEAIIEMGTDVDAGVRNSALVLANERNLPEADELVLRCLKDPDSRVRRKAQFLVDCRFEGARALGLILPLSLDQFNEIAHYAGLGCAHLMIDDPEDLIPVAAEYYARILSEGSFDDRVGPQSSHEHWVNGCMGALWTAGEQRLILRVAADIWRRNPPSGSVFMRRVRELLMWWLRRDGSVEDLDEILQAFDSIEKDGSYVPLPQRSRTLPDAEDGEGEDPTKEMLE